MSLEKKNPDSNIQKTRKLIKARKLIAKTGKNVAQVSTEVFIKLKSVYPLNIALSFLQVVSFSTTVQGAAIVFSQTQFWLAFTLGASIQLLLFFLLILKVAQENFLRRWFSIIVLTILSIYTSFFFIYDGIVGGRLTKNSLNKIQAHSDFKRKIKTNLENRIDELEDKKQKQEDLMKAEEEGRVAGRAGGKGVFWEKHKRERNRLENQINDIKEKLNKEEVKKSFNLNSNQIQQLSPIELYKIDLNAWTSIPKKYRNNTKEPQPSYYDKSDSFLVPFNKVSQGEQKAIIAAILAVTIDGLTLVLGSIGNNKRPLWFFELIAMIPSNLIIGRKKIGATIIGAREQESLPFSIDDNTLSEASTRIIPLTNIKGSVFIMYLLQSIDFDRHIINVEKLTEFKLDSDSNVETYFLHQMLKKEYIDTEEEKQSEILRIQALYRLLIDTMKSPPLNWIEECKEENQSKNSPFNWIEGDKDDTSQKHTNRKIKKYKKTEKNHEKTNKEEDTNETKPNSFKKWKIKDRHYSHFVNWIRIELSRQFNYEQSTSKGVAEIYISANPRIQINPNQDIKSNK